MPILDLPEGKAFDVIGFGTNAVDYLINVPAYPEYNSKVELSSYVQAAGGEVATTMAGLQRLGMKTAYAGRFGDDAAADIGIESLEQEGVALRWTEKVTGASTQIAFIVIDERTGERTVIWKRDPKLAYSPDDAPLQAAGDCRVLHLTPHDTAAARAMAEAARATGAIVSIDIDRVFPGVEELLPFVDIFVSSEDFPEQLTGRSDLAESLTEIAGRYGSRIVCATLGEEGSLILADGRAIRTPGYAVPGGCQDTTGAGDAFRTGLLYGILSGDDLETAAKKANAVAALKCRRVGARTSLPTAQEVDELIAAGPRR